MPPAGKGDPVSKENLDLLKKWIDQGAKLPGAGQLESKLTTDHWSFQPASRGEAGERSIDSFVAEKLRSKKLIPSPRADRRTLIRRLYLTAHGLPPTPAQVEAFLADDTPEHWEKLVDQVLASPRFGERLARLWLDVTRFAESNGFETNRERPNAYHFRDYVIDSFNKDKPYDQFVREQIAGDASGADVATGFLVAGSYDIVKSPDPNLTLMQRQDELADMVNTTGTAFLGLTLGCSRCHNHKFDPITQRDYYQFQAVFAGVSYGDRPIERKVTEDRPDQKLRKEVRADNNIEIFSQTKARFVRFTIRETNRSEPCIDELMIFDPDGKNVATGAKPTSSGDLPGYAIHKLEHINDDKSGNEHSWIADKRAAWIQLEFGRTETIERIEWARDRSGQFTDRLATDYVIEGSVDGKNWRPLASSADRKPPGSDQGSLAWVANFRQPGKTHRLYRGDPMAKREEVAPDALEVLGSLGLGTETPEQQRRVAIADWIASKENPLTARVMANRLWQFAFGTGIVDTPSDFGGNGAAPTHPELLDWLAVEFMENDWSIKHLLRLMLTSTTFQQSSRPRADDAAEIDADARFLWRFPPRRLEAEAIRDVILASSGALDLSSVGGPGFYLLDVDRENVVHYQAKEETGPAEWRRMIYMFKIRQEQDAVFGAFDCPDGNQAIAKRSRSTTPLQALNLFNSRFTIQQGELLAERLSKLPNPAAGAFKKLYGRPVTARELEDAESFIASQGLEAFCRARLNTNELLFIF